MINRVSLYLIIACIFLACKKEQKETISIHYTPDLKIKKVTNDSTIVLKWPKYRGKNFGRYLLKREATYIKNGEFKTFDEFIDSSVDINDTVFTETRMPVAKTIVYCIYVSGPRDEELATDFVIYERPPYTHRFFVM